MSAYLPWACFEGGFEGGVVSWAREGMVAQVSAMARSRGIRDRVLDGLLGREDKI
ncbi:MAG: hypothetical protein JWP89_3257 [Schlesneria sp.]|nr:hypothetical protein [Schlesneria sp.]